MTVEDRVRSIERPDFLAEPIKLKTMAGSYITYLLAVSKRRDSVPWLAPFPDLAPKYSLIQRQAEAEPFDFLLSFAEMKVSRRESFTMDHLKANCFEYKLIEKAFVDTAFGKLPNLKIVKIEKIFNPCIFEKFTGELKRTLKKHPEKNQWDMVKLLFHGSGQTPPVDIYASEYGLDNRYAKDGFYGKVIYFANNIAYSHNYAYRTHLMDRNVC